MDDGTPNGGVVYGIEIDVYKGCYRAYYDPDGNMVDAEDVTYRLGKSIKKGSKLWNAINLHSRLMFARCYKDGMDV